MQRQDLERSLGWPSSLHAAGAQPSDALKGQNEPRSTISLSTKPTHDTFEEDLENNPENHFLSPIQMYEYEDWAEDSDSEDEVEWDAGIMDFALFDEDRRKAQEGDAPLPSKWSDMLAKQNDALQRAVKRSRDDSNSEDHVMIPAQTSDNELPNLTPDTSPDLRDDLDVESFHGQTSLRPSIPNYLTIPVEPSDKQSGEVVEETKDLPLSTYVAKQQQQQRATGDRKLQRPGMRYARTLSGRVHTWRRPSWNIYPVGEDAEAENRAEQEAEEVDGNDQRGRRP